MGRVIVRTLSKMVKGITHAGEAEEDIASIPLGQPGLKARGRTTLGRLAQDVIF